MDQPIVIPLRRCTKCGREFPATTEFFHVAYGSTLRGDCRDCRNAASRAKWVNDDHHRQRVSEWYAKNPGKRAAHVRKYHTSAKGQEAYARKYNRDSNRENMRRWRERNPEKARAAYLRRRRSVVGTVSSTDITEQMRRQRGKCYYCGKSVIDSYHVDHVIPVSRGGLNTPSNIVIACPSCNISKGDKLLHEWKRGGRLI